MALTCRAEEPSTASATDLCNRSKELALFNRLVAAQQERLRYHEPERLGRGQIDDEIELGRLLDRHVSGLRPAQNLVDIVAGAPKQVREVRSIGYQTSRFDGL